MVATPTITPESLRSVGKALVAPAGKGSVVHAPPALLISGVWTPVVGLVRRAHDGVDVVDGDHRAVAEELKLIAGEISRSTDGRRQETERHKDTN